MLIQGTNTPIAIEFDSNTSEIFDISIVLVKDNQILKQWKKKDLTLEGVYCYCPISQEESLLFPAGLATLEIKWTNNDGEVNFNENTSVRIEKRFDQTVLLEVY